MEFGLNHDIIEQIRTTFSSFPEVEKVIIYGSRAKGSYKNGSDIDLTLIGKNLDQSILYKIIDKVDELMLPYTFDISILGKVSNQEFRGHVERVGKVFFEKK